jgi:lactose/L-arabinose transport system substrate-binding protein
MKWKRVLTQALSLTMGLSLLTACSSGGSTSSAEKTKEQGGEVKGEITVAAWNDAADALEAEIPGFEKKYPGIKVTVQRVTSSYDKIIPPLTAGVGAPDIVQIQARDFPNFLMKFPDQFVDLTDTLGSRKEEFAKAAWVSVVKDNKVYGVPWDLGPTAVWYRKDYFQKAGIDPKSLTTWDKFIQAGKQLQEKLGGKVKMTTFDLAGTDTYPTTWQILMNELGGHFYNSKGEIDLANPAAIQAMEMVKRMKDEGIVLNTPTWDDRVRAVVNGDTATIIYPVWYAGTIRHQAKDQQGKWGVFPLPAFTEGGPNQANSGGSVMAITKQSKNKEAAWKFIEYSLLTNEGQDIQLKYGLFPSWKPYYQTEGFKKEDEYFGFPLSEFFGKVSTNIPELEYGPYFLDLRKPLLDAYAAVLNSNVSVEQALKQAEEQGAKATGLKTAH